MAEYQDPAELLGYDQAQTTPISLKVQPSLPRFQEGLTGFPRLLSHGVRGASLGGLGYPEPPETWPQTIAEIAGGVIPMTAAMQAAGPAAAAIPALRTFPIIQRMVAGGLAGSATGAVHAGVTGGDPLQESLIGGALGALGEGAWARWISRSSGRSAPEQTQEAIAARAMGALPPGPSGLGPARTTPVGPGTPPPGPRPGRSWARVVSSETVDDPYVAPTPGATPTYSPTEVPPLGGTLRAPLALGPREPPAIAGPLRPIPIEPLPTKKPTGVGEQLRLLDEGATQLELPMGIIPSGRINRYTTPARYKGNFPSEQLAIKESNILAQQAIREGVQSVRITSSIGPQQGPPTGGIMIVYEAGTGGQAVPVATRLLNIGATKAAQVGASPMRRVSPDWFDVKWSEQLQSDVLIPKSNDVVRGLAMAEGIDPRQISIPFSPEQLSFLQSYQGRAVRQKMDLGTKIPTLDDVFKMDEKAARKAFVEAENAPPLMAVGVVDATADAVRTRSLLADLEITEGEATQFIKSLARGGTARERFQKTLAWLQSRCGTPPGGTP